MSRSQLGESDNRLVLLAIDVGNTQTHIGAFDGAELVEHWRFGTDPEATADELLAVSDRIVVLSAGRIVGEMTSADATREKVMTLATA